jgi:hypothetical protein
MTRFYRLFNVRKLCAEHAFHSLCAEHAFHSLAMS